jgi:hypothetical protein
MKHLLSTTALLAGIAFGGVAFAQEAIPVVDAGGNPLYTWSVDGVLVQGTYTEYTTANTAPTAPAVVEPAYELDGTTPTAEYAAYLTAKSAYDTAAAAYVAPTGLTALVDGGDAAPYTSTSLLDNILADAAELSASLSNVSQNLNDINGSIEVTTDRDYAAIATGIEALTGTYDGFGSYSQVNANVYGVDLPASLLAVLDPLTLELGDLATTAIGTLQSGNMAGTFDASGIVNKVSSSAEGSTTGAAMLAETYGGIANTLAMQNVSVNSGAIDGSVSLILADVDTKAGAIATTAIGALQSGAMTADVSGSMGAVTTTTSALVTSLVGGGV